jgi:hypothetical protein
MASSSHSSGHHDHEHGDHDHHDHDPHKWASPDYVANWAKGQDQKEAHRQKTFNLIADTIPYHKAQVIRNCCATKLAGKSKTVGWPRQMKQKALTRDGYAPTLSSWVPAWSLSAVG